jgi:hypothetical protein
MFTLGSPPSRTPTRVCLPRALSMLVGWTWLSVGHRQAVGESAIEPALGVVTTAWARTAVPLAWANPNALAAGLGQQCQAGGQKSAQHYAADFHIFHFLL